MVLVQRLVLDVLKPHQPNVLEFAQSIAAVCVVYRVHLTVSEVDKHTETLFIVVEDEDLDFAGVQAAI